MTVTDEMVEAGIAAMDSVYCHPAGKAAEVTEQDREAMRAALEAALAAAPTAPQEPVAFDALLREAEDEVRAKPTWKRYIDGTPLANDVPVWMAVFAQHHARQAAAPTAPQEPVAWRYKVDHSRRWHVSEYNPAKVGEWNSIVEAQPLFAHPPAPDALREAARLALSLIERGEGETTWPEYAKNVDAARDVLRKALGEQR